MPQRPKPSSLRRLQGNPGKRAINDAEPKPARAVNLRVPKGRLPADGQRLWRTLAPVLQRMGVLSEADLAPALEMLCLHYSVARDAADEVAKRGILVLGADGSWKKNPAVTALTENSRLLKAYLLEFGLTPASRVRLKVDPDEPEQSLAEILFAAAMGGDDAP